MGVASGQRSSGCGRVYVRNRIHISYYLETHIVNNDRFSRQSFLGEHSQSAIERGVIGVVGLGGGGGHVVQQLAHVGFLNYRLYDGDGVDESNLNRLVIATEA